MSEIENPTLFQSRRVTAEWTVLPSWLPVPGMGVLPVNSFLLKGHEPMLVDTGLGALGEPYVAALENEIDLDDLAWIWLSHMDADHIGNLVRILKRARNATVITNFLGLGKLQLAGIDAARVHLLEPGVVFEAGGRRLHPVRPPYYDAPETIGFFDETDRVFFSADSFGALLPEAVGEIDEVAPATLRDGLVGWASVDAPWLAAMDCDALGRTLSAAEALDPDFVLSGHLPLARKAIRALTRHVADAYGRGATAAAAPLSIEHVVTALDARADA